MVFTIFTWSESNSSDLPLPIMYAFGISVTLIGIMMTPITIKLQKERTESIKSGHAHKFKGQLVGIRCVKTGVSQKRIWHYRAVVKYYDQNGVEQITEVSEKYYGVKILKKHLGKEVSIYILDSGYVHLDLNNDII